MTTPTNIKNILNEISSTTKSKEKEEILHGVSRGDDQIFRRVVNLSLDPFWNFWVISYDKTPTEAEKGTWSLEDALDMLEFDLHPRFVTGDDAVKLVEEAYAGLPTGDDEVFDRILQGNLKCGVGAKGFNKVWPSLVYIHPYMRCSSFSEKNMKNISMPCISQVKMDGLYVDVVVNQESDGERIVEYLSRSGRELPFNHTGIDADFSDGLANGDEVVFMGEALALNEDKTEFMERSKSNGYLNSSDIDPSRVFIVLWDLVSVEQEFAHGKTERPYIERWEDLQGRMDSLYQVIEDPKVDIVESKVVNNSDEAIDHFFEVSKKGGEGTVIKDFSGIWKDGTSKHQVKLKIEFEVDLKVVGYVEGTNSIKGQLGSLICETSDGLLRVKVGTGFSAPQRKSLWKVVDEMVEEGAIVSVTANEILHSDEKEDSLFLPRFGKVRKDKSEPDSYERVVEQRDSFILAVRAIDKGV